MFQAGRRGAGCLNEKWLILVYLRVLLSLLNPRSCVSVSRLAGWAHSPLSALSLQRGGCWVGIWELRIWGQGEEQGEDCPEEKGCF